MGKNEEDKLVRVNFYLRQSVLEKAKKKSARVGAKYSAVFRQAIDKYLASAELDSMGEIKAKMEEMDARLELLEMRMEDMLG